ncbi:MAG: radical SAM protein [Candidatus Nanopelagicales bacterium]
MSPPLGLVADVVRFSWVDGPGNRYVVFFQGCGFDCVACHNPHTIPLHTPRAREMSVEALVADLRPVVPFLSGVTASGGESTLQADFLRAWFEALKSDPGLAGLTTFVDSNGSASRATWDRLAPVMDAAMIDLKALAPEVHRLLTGEPNDAVLDSIRHLSDLGKLHEVRLLLVPGVNDDERTLRRTAEWLLDVDPAMRVRVIGFRRHGVRAAARDFPEATEEQRADYVRILVDAGVRDPLLV